MSPLDTVERMLRPDLPARFLRSGIDIAEGEELAPADGDWAASALVVVVRGALLVEQCSGAAAVFGAGAILSLDGIGVRAIRCAGPGPVSLAAFRLDRSATRGPNPIEADDSSAMAASDAMRVSTPAPQDRSAP